MVTPTHSTSGVAPSRGVRSHEPFNIGSTIWKVIKVAIVALLLVSALPVASAYQEPSLASSRHAVAIMTERLAADKRACCPRLKLHCIDNVAECTIFGSRPYTPEELYSILYTPSTAGNTYNGAYPYIFRRDMRGSFVVTFESVPPTGPGQCSA